MANSRADLNHDHRMAASPFHSGRTNEYRFPFDISMKPLQMEPRMVAGYQTAFVVWESTSTHNIESLISLQLGIYGKSKARI